MSIPKTLIEFRTKQPLFVSLEKIVWPCINCKGSGKIYDPLDQPDIYHRRSKITCQDCAGTGKGSKTKWQKWWKEYKNEISNEKKKLKDMESHKISTHQRTILFHY